MTEWTKQQQQQKYLKYFPFGKKAEKKPVAVREFGETLLI